MTRFVLFTVLLFACNLAFSQSYVDFPDTQKITIDGVEFGYNISNDPGNRIDSTGTHFLTINWYLINKDRFSKIFLVNEFQTKKDNDIDLTEKICLGKLFIRNAVESKFSTITADPNTHMQVFRKRLIARKKDKVSAYKLEPGQMLSSNLVVQASQNKKPEISLQAFISPVY